MISQQNFVSKGQLLLLCKCCDWNTLKIVRSNAFGFSGSRSTFSLSLSSGKKSNQVGIICRGREDVVKVMSAT
jgi:hypothetical protein